MGTAGHFLLGSEQEGFAYEPPAVPFCPVRGWSWWEWGDPDAGPRPPTPESWPEAFASSSSVSSWSQIPLLGPGTSLQQASLSGTSSFNSLLGHVLQLEAGGSCSFFMS